uniref:Si:dkey-100n23.5 n=1 Tax=Astyanax mexicanus TaxID=7994 RepID=A0A3B1K3I4_ASTMX
MEKDQTINSENISSSRCTFFTTQPDDYRCEVILAVKKATGTFSLVALFMLFVIWLLRRYNSLAQKMIVSLTVAAFFDSVAYVMGESHPEGTLCNFQAWWLTYFLYHIVAWGIPLLMSALPLIQGYYGPAGAWWITDDHVAWRFGWYVPLFTLILLMICCYARIIYVASDRMQSWLGTFNPERERRKLSLAEEIRPLKWYPSVYLLVSLFPLLNLHNAVYPEQPVFSLTLLHVLSAPLHGLANALVFGKDTWSQLSTTGFKMAVMSRLCDSTRIGEYHPASVKYSADLESDSDDDDNNVLFYSPDMSLKERGP